MKRFLISLAVVLAVCLGIGCWLARPRYVEPLAAGRALPAPSLIRVAQAQTAAPPVVTPARTESILPAGEAPKTPAELGANREKSDFYAKAKVLAERATPPDAEGKFRKVRLLEAEGKYPFIRIEEEWGP